MAKTLTWLAAFFVFLGAAVYLFGYVDGLFFRAPSFSREIFGMQLARKDLYFAAITAFFAAFALSCISALALGQAAAKEGKKVNLPAFALFLILNILLFSIWLWAISWMQITDFFDSQSSKQLDLWKVGTLQISVKMNEFYLLIAASFLVHAGIFYATAKKDWIIPAGSSQSK